MKTRGEDEGEKEPSKFSATMTHQGGQLSPFCRYGLGIIKIFSFLRTLNLI